MPAENTSGTSGRKNKLMDGLLTAQCAQMRMKNSGETQCWASRVGERRTVLSGLPPGAVKVPTGNTGGKTPLASGRVGCGRAGKEPFAVRQSPGFLPRPILS